MPTALREIGSSSSNTGEFVSDVWFANDVASRLDHVVCSEGDETERDQHVKHAAERQTPGLFQGVAYAASLLRSNFEGGIDK